MPFVIQRSNGQYFDATGRGPKQWTESKTAALQFARTRDANAFNSYLRGNKVGKHEVVNTSG